MTPSQTFHDHVQELRGRIAWLVLTIGVSSVAGYAFRVPIINFLQHPLGGPLFYTSPAGSFNFTLKVATSLGLMLALPLIIYHLIRFIEPALPRPIKRSLIIKVIFFSTTLAIMGVSFGYFVMIPMSLHFFSTYSSAHIKPMISVDAYLTFVLNQLVTFAVLFQLPLIILFINRIKPIKPSQLLKFQRHVVVGAFVIAVILPFSYDPISQFVMAVPIVFLYYFSILLVWIANRRTEYIGKVVKEEDLPTPKTPNDPPAQTPYRPVQLPARAQRPSPSRAIVRPTDPVMRPQVARSTMHRRTLRLDPLNPTPPNRYNLLDLSGGA